MRHSSQVSWEPWGWVLSTGKMPTPLSLPALHWRLGAKDVSGCHLVPDQPGPAGPWGHGCCCLRTGQEHHCRRFP